jgi:hypothetical protein
VLLPRDRFISELLEAGDEGFAEAVQAVALCGDGGVLYAVEMATYLFGGVNAVVKVRDEGGDGALEVDIVFPERVVCIYKKSLSRRVTVDFEAGIHLFIIERLIEAWAELVVVAVMVDLRKIFRVRTE